jgi:glycosyltransferase involved in cell wall biosynthesis
MRFAVAVITRRRPHGLSRLMESLDRLEPSSGAGPIDIRVLVIENDDAPSTLPPSRWPCTHVLEPRRGIPAARNRALDEAMRLEPAPDWIAFVDDDETVEPDWLRHLADAAVGAPILTGPARPALPGPVPAWALATRAYVQPDHADGATVNEAYTNNIALHRSLVALAACRFDERLLLRGGSDTHLTRMLARSGHAIRWCARAVTHEHYPASRLTPSWALRRAYRVGATNAWIDLDLGIRSRAGCLVLAARFVVRGMVRSLASIISLQPGAAVMHPGLDAAKALGLVFGALGLDRFEEYRTHHGD